jgi:hypothetical protein
MGDWEDIFGEGVSAESVIDGICGDCDDDRETRKELERRSLAYRGDPTIKDALLAQIEDHYAAGRQATAEDGLKCLMRNPEGTYEDLEVEYSIPQSFARLVDAIFAGMKGESEDKLETASARHWLFYCMNRIKPGADLRLIAPRFAAKLAHAAFLEPDRGFFVHDNRARAIRDACAPALGAAFARARGVEVQDGVALATTNAAWASLAEASKGPQIPGNVRDQDVGAAIIGAAAYPKPENAALAAQYAAVAGIGGSHLGELATWEIYAHELIQLVDAAPTGRSKKPDIIDLDDLSSRLSGKNCGQSFIGALTSSQNEERSRHAFEETNIPPSRLTAFNGDHNIKTTFRFQLENHYAAGKIGRDQGALQSLSNEAGGYTILEHDYRIPQSLSRLIDTIYIELRYRDKKETEYSAIDWLFSCVDSIRTGVDLRLVAPKFAADLASTAFFLPRDKSWVDWDAVRNACAPALAIACARARGVIVQDEVAAAAVKSAFSVVCDDWEEHINGDKGRLDSGELAAMIIGTAADPKPESAALVAHYSAVARISPSGDATELDNWNASSLELIGLIEAAPTARLRIVDLNEISSRLFGASTDENA